MLRETVCKACERTRAKLEISRNRVSRKRGATKRVYPSIGMNDTLRVSAGVSYRGSVNPSSTFRITLMSLGDQLPLNLQFRGFPRGAGKERHSLRPNDSHLPLLFLLTQPDPDSARVCLFVGFHGKGL